MLDAEITWISTYWTNDIVNDLSLGSRFGTRLYTHWGTDDIRANCCFALLEELIRLHLVTGALVAKIMGPRCIHLLNNNESQDTTNITLINACLGMPWSAKQKLKRWLEANGGHIEDEQLNTF